MTAELGDDRSPDTTEKSDVPVRLLLSNFSGRSVETALIEHFLRYVGPPLRARLGERGRDLLLFSIGRGTGGS